MTRLVAFTAAWIVSLWLAQAAFFHPIWFFLTLPAAVVLHFGWRHERRGRLALWALAGMLLGAGRFLLWQAPIDESHIARYNGADFAQVTGLVTAAPDRRTRYTNLRVSAEQISFVNGQSFPVHGELLVKAPVYTPARYGDRVQVSGTLEIPPVFEGFSYRDYLARQGIYTLLRRADLTVLESHQANRLLDGLLRFREYALTRLLQILPEPQAALLAGILLGVESGIPEELNAAFSATGTTHIVAISGFNLTIIAGVFALLARRAFGEKGETPVALAGVWLYTLLVGASAAVVRAAVMGSLAIFARRERRPLHGPTSLALAALAMSVHNPLVLWDVGFQLSLAATAGLIFFTDPLTNLFLRGLGRWMSAERAEQAVGWLSEALLLTLAAQITTTPIIVATFQRLSLVTLFTNFLILPVQSFVMLFGGVALLVALLWLPLGQLLGWLAWVFLTYTIEVVRWTATFAWASVPVPGATWPLVAAYYLLLGGAFWWFSRRLEERQYWWTRWRQLPQWRLVGGLAVVALLGAYLWTMPDGRLHIFFLDVGQGDAVFIRTPTGRQVVIDGGPDAPALLSQVGRRMPFWDRTLDLVALSSPDDARLAGLIPLLERYQVDFVASGAEEGAGSHYERWVELLNARSAETEGVFWAGSEWELDEGVWLRALWPEHGTVGPLVLRLDYGETSVLLPGGATTVVEGALVSRDAGALRSAVLQIPRHGARTGSTPAFLEAVAPEIAIISVGEDERADTPAPQVLARLMDLALYRTDLHGTLEIISDGETVAVRVERGASE